MNDIDILTSLAIISREESREFWNVIGMAASALMLLLAFAYAAARFLLADKASAMLAWTRRHPWQSFVRALMVAAAIAYGGSKAVTPTVEQCDYNMTGATEPESGVVRYHYFASATNGVDVAMNAGLTTNTVSSVAAGQMYYEFSPTTYGGTDADVADYGFWVRDAVSNEWTRAATDATYEFPPSTHNYHGRMAHLPDMEDAKDYRFWFIGREEHLPEVIIEGGVGIVIDRVVITASHVHIEFHPEDPDLAKGAFQYVLQTRVTRQDVLMDWENVTATTATGSGGAFDFDGYTVGEYREYRVYADKEVSE